MQIWGQWGENSEQLYGELPVVVFFGDDVHEHVLDYPVYKKVYIQLLCMATSLTGI